MPDSLYNTDNEPSFLSVLYSIRQNLAHTSNPLKPLYNLHPPAWMTKKEPKLQ